MPYGNQIDRLRRAMEAEARQRIGEATEGQLRRVFGWLLDTESLCIEDLDALLGALTTLDVPPLAGPGVN